MPYSTWSYKPIWNHGVGVNKTHSNIRQTTKHTEKTEETNIDQRLEDKQLEDAAQLMLDWTTDTQTGVDLTSVGWNDVNLRGMVTLKCWGSEINSFLLSSFKPTPVGPAQTQTEVTESNNSSLNVNAIVEMKVQCYISKTQKRLNE